MTKNSKGLLQVTEKLNKENKKLQQQLREAKKSIDEIKTGNIDALVFADKKDLKVYTEKTADKTYRVLVEKMNEGAVTLHADGTVLYCNSCFASMVSLPLQKAIGKKFKNFICNSSKRRFEVLFKHGWKKVVKEEIYICSCDNRVIPVLMAANAYSIDNNLALSIILTDLTVQNKNQEKLKRRTKQLEKKNAELQSANKELAFQIEEKKKRTTELNIAHSYVKELDALNTHKESILAILSHDLRSPLANIILITQSLKSNIDNIEPAELNQMIDFLYKSSTEELNMLDNLLEWARIKYAAEAFKPTKIELSQYMEKAFDTFKETAAANSINLQNSMEENVFVFADEKMLRSIIQNLVSNALKNTPAGGKITVASKRKEDKIIVEIKDTGSGMPKEVVEKLFFPQMQTLLKARKENKGAGIGLLLVKGFLEKNGGEIWVESKEGTGTSFYFTLPVNNPADKTSKESKIEFAKND